ncbi:InlB B-repeat-containing protein [Paenibacillus hodogayensis]|uniref:InlB B-repeat-containing protein n=1 Tax=Paenibacillus hodogayensis TaxID=279208 RepID=A0ABV5W7U2_9BACL
MKSKIRTRMRFVCLLLFAVLLYVPGASGRADAVATGVADGTYDFGGTLAAYDNTYKKTGDKFLVNKDLVKSGTSLWPQTQKNGENPGYMLLTAEGTTTLGSFTFQDLGFSATSDNLRLDFIHITLMDAAGATITTIDNYRYGGTNRGVGKSTVKLSAMLNFNKLFQFKNVKSIKILWIFADDADPSRLKLDNITIANAQKGKYNVTFNSYGGTAVNSQSIFYNERATAPTAPTRPGFTFGGWYADPELTKPFAFTTAITGNTTLYAKWTMIMYTVTFNSKGGPAVSSQSVFYGGTAYDPSYSPPIARTGYGFGGWYMDEALTRPFDFDTVITRDMTLYAKWTAINYSVTFESNGGTAVNSQTVSYNNKATAPANPTRTGYTFGGWYTNTELTTAFTFTTAITGNTKLYAKWTLNNYAVTFESNGGTAVSSQTVGYNNKATAPANPTRTGYTFGGWYTDPEWTKPFAFTTAITGNTKLYAKWTLNNYTVTFESNGGTTVSSQTVGYNNKATTPTAPTRTGYTFGGWYTNTALTTAFAFTTVITGDTKLYAKWTLNNYTVKFESNGGTTVSNQTVSYNNRATAPTAPTKPGNTFGGWYTNTGLTTAFAFTTAITVDTKLYAKWTLNNYTVTFESNGGTTVSSQTVGYNNRATAPTAPTRTGYTFGGWYTNTGLTTAFAFTTAITGDTKLYAKWTLNNYTVTFESNGGTLVSSQTVSYNNRAAAPPAPTRTGYTFGGWYKDAGLTEAFAFTTAITGNTTLRAKWLPNYTVKFESNGGTPVSSQTVASNSTAAAPGAPTKLGHTFGGWYTNAGLTTPASFGTAITGNTILYAKWIPHIYTVTFDTYGGTTVDSLMVSYGSMATAPADPTKTGYTFGGWYTNAALTMPFLFTTSITADTTLHAGWATDSFAVTFHSNGGTSVNSQAVSYGTLATAPATPTKVGHTFAGWYMDEHLTAPFQFTTAIAGDTGLYANWTEDEYTLTFDSKGGTPVTVMTATYDDLILAPVDPTKTDYAFAGWHSDEELTVPFPFPAMITVDTTVYAKWVEERYTVTFDSNGGTAVTVVTATYNNTIASPGDPTKTGYTFGGWHTNEELTLPFEFTSTVITGDRTLYAKWTEEEYTLTFDSTGGTTVSSQPVSYNHTAVEPPDPTQSGFTFGGWFMNSGLTEPYTFSMAITGDMVLYASWLADSYTVTFDSNEGSITQVGVPYNGLVTAPAVPVRTSYTFGGWYTDEELTLPFEFTTTVITGDRTLYAKWTAEDYTVTFESNGGTPVSSQTVSYNNVASAPTDPTNIGNIFAGWYTDMGLTAYFSFATVITGDMTLYAKWATDSNAVTFDSNGGTAVSSVMVSYNSTFTAPADPIKSGYTFGGWYVDEDLTALFAFSTPIMGDTTLYAKWATDSYAVTFNSNGGTSVGSLAVSYNGTTPAPVDPTKAGYTFAGWFTDTALTESFTFTTAITSDMMLHASWTTNSYKVTFDSKEGSAVSSQEVGYNGIATAPADPVKAGYTFAGWYADDELTVPFPFTTVIMGDLTVHAKWVTDSYAVTFNSNGGTAISGQAVSYNTTATAPADPTKTGSTFAGWYMDAELTAPFSFAAIITGNTTLYAKWTTSSSADLSSLVVSDTMPNPAFDPDTTYYSANVLNSTTAVTLTASVYDRHASIKVNNTAVTSGQATEVLLNEGNNTIVVDVTAQDGSAKAYSVSVTRAPKAPVGLEGYAADGKVALNWQSVPGAVSYSVYGGTASRSYGAIPMETVSGATYSYMASGLTNGTGYYFTIMANNIGGTSLYSNEVMAMPLSEDASLESLRLTDVTLSPTFERSVFSYEARVANLVWTTTVTAMVYEKNASVIIRVNGMEVSDGQAALNVGRNTIDIVVVAQNGTTSTYIVTVDRMSSGSSGSYPSYGEPQEVQLMIDGQSYDHLAKVTKTGEHELTVTIDAAQMQGYLDKNDNISVVGMRISSKVDDISVLLPGDIVKAMERKHIVWEVRAPYGGYSLPASEIGIDRLVAQLGAEALTNVNVQVRIGKSSFNWENWNGAAVGDGIVGQPVDFRITAAYKEHTVTVREFFSYIKLEIPLPDGTEPNEITTAVVMNEDGTFHHVPTYVRSEDGRHFAIIHSFTNGVYALVKNHKTFADVDKHWSKNAVNDLASRFIVNGIDETHYNPDGAVTRAEFAAIIVRALGLSNTGGNAAFTDVKSGDWYAGVVSKAQEYGIIDGYEDGSFRPANTITREEAMALVIRAMKLTGLETAITTTDIEATLSMFSDSEAVSAWAKPAVALAVRNGIVNGTDAGLMPASDITRAETAAIVQRMLRKAKLID